MGLKYCREVEEVVSKIVNLEEVDEGLSQKVVGEGSYTMNLLRSLNSAFHLSWNARGLGRSSKRCRLSLIKEQNFDMISLLETKTTVVTERFVKSLWKDNNFEYVEVDSDGRAGGVQMNASLMQQKLYSHDRGDWNEIKNPGESGRDREMRDFNQFIETMEWVDIPHFGRRYTWSNTSEWSKWSGMDSGGGDMELKERPYGGDRLFRSMGMELHTGYQKGRLEDVIWKGIFRRQLFSSEEGEVSTLINLVKNAPTLNQNREVGMIWKFGSSCRFSVRSLYKQWEITSLPKAKSMAVVWRNAAPPRVKCFGWLAYLGRVTSSDFLMRLGIIGPQNGGVCMFCGVMPESVDHLLVLCPLVWRIRCECELVGFDMGYPKFNKAIVTMVAEQEIQEGKEMAMGGYPMAILWGIFDFKIGHHQWGAFVLKWAALVVLCLAAVVLSADRIRCECELVGFDMGYPKFSKAIVTVVAEQEIQEGKEMAMRVASRGIFDFKRGQHHWGAFVPKWAALVVLRLAAVVLRADVDDAAAAGGFFLLIVSFASLVGILPTPTSLLSFWL
ncbi:hypothetical protein Acr_22g0005130 [Actinidia rufa]|uniref:Reverse transcriptase zinc-binding domain-containing protein n=1 Tax=Actinidia rufa TaxID=165716 RepID=A0A7J0GK10_9ERIC|nr:hypothetical protein Acr_22g0005130 [Actinidia rufa]